MVGNQEVVNKINAQGAEMFNRRLDHDINRLLGTGNG